MKQGERTLSFKLAQACEFAIEKRCRCRCAGRAHGRGLLVADLPTQDPHQVNPERITLAELEEFFSVRLERRDTGNMMPRWRPFGDE